MKGRHKAEHKETATPEQLDGQGQDGVGNDLGATVAALQKASDERDQLRDQLLRTMADFQNFRKRTDEQRRQLETFATERMATALLPVLDNFERALASLDTGASADSIVEGLKAVDRQFRQVLESHNVSRIQSVGAPFDPEYHEALAIQESDEHENDTVVEELEPGYRMGDKVIRPARVRVSRKP
jgi:molecular chaperone GrpE